MALRRVHPAVAPNIDPVGTLEEPIIVVLVPSPKALRHLPPADWAIAQADCFATQGLSVRVLSFDYTIAVDESFTWDAFLALSSVLATAVKELYASGAYRGPLLFAAHSLASYLVMKCMVLARDKPEYNIIEERYAGCLFMGALLNLAERETCARQACAILQSGRGKLPSKVASTLTEEATHLSQIVSEFDKLGLNADLVSIYEEDGTSEKYVFGRRARPVKLVDKPLTILGQRDAFGVATNHANIPRLLREEGKADAQCMAKIHNMLSHAYESVRRSAPTSLRAPSPSKRLSRGPSRRRVAQSSLKTLQEEFQIREAPDPAKFPHWGVTISRRPSESFCGRQEVLERLKRLLIPCPGLATLCSGPGNGKTETALQFAQSVRGEFDAVFWLRSDTTTKLRQDFESIAYQLDLISVPSSVNAADARLVVKNWLSHPILPRPAKSRRRSSSGEAQCLVILDGADKCSVLDELDWLWLHGKCSVLITSRDPSMEAWISKKTNEYPASIRAPSMSPYINLERFQEDAAYDLLLKLVDSDKVKTSEDQDAAKDIARGLGGSSLAITQMAGVVQAENLSFARLRQKYRAGHVLERATLQQTLASLIRFSDFHPRESELLALFAMLDPDCIQESMFLSVSSSDAFQQFHYLSVAGYRESRKTLLGASVVKISEVPGQAPAKQELWMHWVLQDTVRQHCMDGDLLQRAFRAAVLFVSAAWPTPDSMQRGENIRIWQPCTAVMPHVQHLQKMYELLRTSAREPEHALVYKKLAALLREGAEYAREHGTTEGVYEMLQMAKSVCEKLPEGFTFKLLPKIYHSLGAWANETNHVEECVRYSSLYLQIEQRRQDAREDKKPSRRTAMAWNECGLARMMCKEYEEAKKCFATSLEIYRSLPDQWPCYEDSLPVVNMGFAEWLLGNLEAAERIIEAGLGDREDHHGQGDLESFKTGRFYHALANVYHSQGRFAESYRFHRRALTQYQLTIGRMHHRTADLCYRVADHCLRKGEYGDAKLLLNQALTAYNHDESSFRPEIARTTFLQARQVAESGNPARSLELRQKAADLRRLLVQGCEKSTEDLEQADFDALVTFWSL